MMIGTSNDIRQM